MPGTYTRYLFWCCGILTKIPRKPFCAWWHIFNTFVPTCALDFRTKHGQNNIHKCDTKGFVPVAGLNGVLVLPYLFIRSLIVSNGKMWSIVYMNAKWRYAYETLACIISECAIVRNVLHITSTCPFISWCSGADNVKWTPWVWNHSLNSLEVHCVPASAEILF